MSAISHREKCDTLKHPRYACTCGVEREELARLRNQINGITGAIDDVLLVYSADMPPRARDTLRALVKRQ